MKKIKFASVVFILLIMSGCGLLTLHPIFSPDDLVFKTELLGKWKAEGSVLQIEPATSISANEIPVPLRSYNKRFYVLRQMDSDGTEKRRSLAFLVKIGPYYFIDLYPIETQESAAVDVFFKENQYKLHQVTRIAIASGKLYWQDFQDNYVEELIKNKQVRIKYTRINEIYSEEDDTNLLITAGTKELQAFLSKYGSKEEAFNAVNKSNTYIKISGL